MGIDEDVLPFPGEEPKEELKLYTLVNIKEWVFVKRAPCWEIQSWTKLLQGPDGWKVDPAYKKLEVLTFDELKELHLHVIGLPSHIEDRDELLTILQIHAQQIPIDETSIEQLRRMLVDKYGSGIGEIHRPTQGDTMSTTQTAATANKATKEKKEKAPRPKGAKVLVRELYAAQPQGAFTVEEIAKQIGKPSSSVTTAISDLRSAKYCKPGVPLVLHRHSDGKYRLTAEVKAAGQPAGPGSALPIQ